MARSPKRAHALIYKKDPSEMDSDTNGSLLSLVDPVTGGVTAELQRIKDGLEHHYRMLQSPKVPLLTAAAAATPFESDGLDPCRIESQGSATQLADRLTELVYFHCLKTLKAGKSMVQTGCQTNCSGTFPPVPQDAPGILQIVLADWEDTGEMVPQPYQAAAQETPAHRPG